MYKYHLSDVKWGEFFISEIFSFTERGRRLKIDDRENGNIPFVTAGESDNGISSFICNIKQKSYNKAITIDMFGNAFFQKGCFKCDDNITVLQNDLFSDSLYIFLTSRLNILNEKYSYGKQLRPNRLIRDKIMLPTKEDGNPNWHFMEEYIKERENKQRNDLKEYYKSRLIDLVVCPEVLTDVEWGEFSLRDIFVFERGNQNNMSGCEAGDIPLISAKKIDNGVKAFISDNGKKLFEGHILTLNNDGDGGVGIAYYQANKMALDTHVTALIPIIPISRNSLLFISKTITIQRDKFSHGYSLNNNRMKAQKIVLPIDKNGNPYWYYMENFIKNIEQKQIKNILKYLDEYIYIYNV
ncbi:restriction endonuclease subunit S [Peptostreptococcus stomatis]